MKQGSSSLSKITNIFSNVRSPKLKKSTDKTAVKNNDKQPPHENADEDDDCLANWKFSQVKGAGSSAIEDVCEDDIITNVTFNKDGTYLATGDKAGRIVVFKRIPKSAGKAEILYDLYSTFQSHKPQFDFLKSMQIDEKINVIKWLEAFSYNDKQFMLSANDKVVKLWKLIERDKKFEKDDNTDDVSDVASVGDNNNIKRLSTGSADASPSRKITRKDLKLPTMKKTLRYVDSLPKRVYDMQHEFNINSVALNNDQETFLSADDLRINLWNFRYTQARTILDIKPNNLEDITHVITTLDFNPVNSHTFVYGTSRGTVNMGDLRTNLSCKNYVKLFKEGGGGGGGGDKNTNNTTTNNNNNFFSEIINCISHVKYMTNETFLTRDYLCLKTWDTRFDNRSVDCFHIDEKLRAKLCMLYENEHIFDRFECGCNENCNYLLTGSYANSFHIFNRLTKKRAIYEAVQVQQQTGIQQQQQQQQQQSKEKTKKVNSKSKTGGGGGSCNNSSGSGGSSTTGSSWLMNASSFEKKILHMDWNVDNVIAIGAVNQLYFYQNKSINN